MKLSRNYITPFILLVFLVVGISGVLMFFHQLEGYTEVMHEILGLFFILFAILHIILNWKALKIHFKKGVLLPVLTSILIISAILILSERMSPPVDLQMMGRLVKAPVGDAFKALNIPYEEAATKLKDKGILVEKAHNLEDLWMQNDADPEEIIDLLLE